MRYKLPEFYNEDINEFEKTLGLFKNGKITAKELRSYRVPFGIYEQRINDTFMMRIRCPGGVVDPEQLKKVSELSDKFGSDSLHITTRQELQIHSIKGVDNLIHMIRELQKVDLSTRGGGGNTVRNMIAQEDAGVDIDELFDVTPYVIALTERLIAEKESWTLPRKYKIAFSGSEKDKGYATINDVGFIAKIKDGEKGFKVFVAGGMGAKSDTAKILFDFISENEVLNIAEAIKFVFSKYGNRRNKHTARLRFLYNKLGKDEFEKKFWEEYNAIKEKKLKPLDIKIIDNKDQSSNGINIQKPIDNEDFLLWKERFVNTQKQPNLVTILLPIELGILNNKALAKFSEFIADYGKNTVRLTKEQNILIRNIKVDYLPNFYNFIKENFSNFNRPFFIDKMIACTGADTCKLGICLSQKALKYSVIPKLLRSGIDLDNISDMRINISGCPNACGQHPIADLGFFGKSGRKDEYLYPAYNVLIGGTINENSTKLNKMIGEVSAYRLADFITEVIKAFVSKKEKHNTFHQYINSEGSDEIKDILQKYKDIPTFFEDKNYYFDISAKEIFSLANRGIGECSAGLFDLIEMDLENIEILKKEIVATTDSLVKSDKIDKLVYFASRMLLITRGVEPKNRIDLFDAFIENFIDTKIVKGEYRDLIEASKKENSSYLKANEDLAIRFANSIIELYNNMDDSFNFTKTEPDTKTSETNISKKDATENITNNKESIKENIPTIKKDFRGVQCPINFVKTKIELSKIKSGELLEIYLDDGDPINNVPGSVKNEGHTIIETRKIDNWWSVLIKKS